MKQFRKKGPGRTHKQCETRSTGGKAEKVCEGFVHRLGLTTTSGITKKVGGPKPLKRKKQKVKKVERIES